MEIGDIDYLMIGTRLRDGTGQWWAVTGMKLERFDSILAPGATFSIFLDVVKVEEDS